VCTRQPRDVGDEVVGIFSVDEKAPLAVAVTAATFVYVDVPDGRVATRTRTGACPALPLTVTARAEYAVVTAVAVGALTG
jgi:hypothetical protein